jgi:ADP-dependent NAD(P)H-hydrate dehydratase / NAD(P)H-hydrate epimerase
MAMDLQPRLMQRAGAAAAQWIQALIGERPHPVLFLIGPGNNGGDALVCARLLMAQGYDCICVGLPANDLTPADARDAHVAFLAAGGQLFAEIPQGNGFRFSLIVDGLFGIGLHQSLTEPYAGWVEAANTLSLLDNLPLMALDIPSGLHADTGVAESLCIEATHTLTYIANKPGLLTGDGPDHSGQVKICDLDIPGAAFTAAGSGTFGMLNDPASWANELPQRYLNANKGDAGSAGLLGGSPSMTGALLLAARSALHAGAGRVYAAALGGSQAGAPTLDPLQPEIMFRDPSSLRDAPLTALGVGPGLGRTAVSRAVLASALDFEGALVLDADALVLLPTLSEQLRERNFPTLLTPHPGEAAALLDTDIPTVEANRIKAACDIADQYHATVVLKGCGSIIATPDGRWWINNTGNPGMASAGMGDVLTGLTTALLAQGMPAEQALCAAVWLHGAAADACIGLENSPIPGPLGLTASEVILAIRTRLNELI